MIKRLLNKQIEKRLPDQKVIVLLGPRQVGKTTLMKKVFFDQDTKYYNGDDPAVREIFKNKSTNVLKKTLQKYKRVIIDEAQRIENIGITLKQIHDDIEDVKVLATGSSAFELSNQINEPLTGRKWEFIMYPMSIIEMIDHHGHMKEKQLLEHRLTYGMYPEVINHPGDEKEILGQLADSYLYKDLLTWEEIKKPHHLEKLLQALAFQIGNEVSYHEIGKIIGLNNETVERYIDLLEKAFIIFRLPSLSRNLRNELKKRKKVYFYDLGIRNAVIKNWNPISMRNDIGQLWENFLIIERRKHKAYNSLRTNDFFWRTHAQQEIDYLEEYNGVLYAYEFKWNPKRKAKFSKSFTNAYPNHKLEKVTSENYLEYITDNYTNNPLHIKDK